MPFEWNVTQPFTSTPVITPFNEATYSTTHPCHKCFFRNKHPHHRDGPEWNCTTTIIWECGVRHKGIRLLLHVKYDHRTRVVKVLFDNYRKIFGEVPCEDKSVLKI